MGAVPQWPSARESANRIGNATTRRGHMVECYRSARDFFEAVRCAAIEVGRTERQIERMKSAEGVRAQGYGPAGKGSRSDVNGTAVTDARMDYEARMRRRLEEDRALIAEGCALVYGPDNRGGVAKLLGSAAADAMWWRYCAGESWTKAAEMVGASVKTLQRWCEVAVDTVDGIGFDAVRSGTGTAES